MTTGPFEPQSDQLSPDGRWRWDGTKWVPHQAAPAWAPPPQPGTALPGPAQRVSAPIGISTQFRGNALWSMVFGLASVLVPIFTPIYFPILPLVGIWRGYLAVRSGQAAGGWIGIVINLFGALISLLVSGLLSH